MATTETYKYYTRDGHPRFELIKAVDGQTVMHVNPFDSQIDTEITKVVYDQLIADNQAAIDTAMSDAKAYREAKRAEHIVTANSAKSKLIAQAGLTAEEAALLLPTLE